MRPSETASEGSWEHPSQPINTRKDPQGSREGEGNRTWFPLEAVRGESRGPRSVFHRTCWDGSHTQKACLQGTAPQGARLTMGQNGWLWHTVTWWRCGTLIPTQRQPQNGSVWRRRLPESFKQRLSFCSLPTHRGQAKNWLWRVLAPGCKVFLLAIGSLSAYSRRATQLRGTIVGCYGNTHLSWFQIPFFLIAGSYF